jgi:COPI associated protein
LSEFQVKPLYIAKYFNFLDNPIGKGLWLIMVGLMLTEITNITEAILCVILAVLGLFNIALGIAYLALQIKPENL